MITGLIGLRPRMDNTVEVNPLIPEGKLGLISVWIMCCIMAVTSLLLWDKDGSRYQRGKGLHIYVDGKEVGHADTLTRVLCENVL